MLRSTIPSGALIELNSIGIKNFVYVPARPLELIGAVDLALSRKAAPPKARADSEGAHFELSRPLNILAVDDSRDNQLLMRGYLERHAGVLMFADDGRDALEKFRRNSFDIVFMDILMPVMDGYDAAKAMRAWEHQAGRRHTPIVAVSAHASEPELEKCRKAGFSKHFAKPLDLNEFQEFLSKTFGTKSEKTRPMQNELEKTWQDKLKAYLPTYFKQRRDDLENLKSALAAADWETVVRIGHKIKGSAATYGFPDLGEAAAQLEEEASHKDATKVRAGIDFIEDWLRHSSA